MEDFDFIVYLSKSIQIDGIKVFFVIFFGFGQKGVQVIGVYFKYFFVIFDEQIYVKYCVKVEVCQKKVYCFFYNGFINNSLFVLKVLFFYIEEQFSFVFFNFDVRVIEDVKFVGLIFFVNFMK